jgi:hypothetical protein
MKVKALTITTLIILCITACGGRSSNNQDMHTHGEGCTHEKHAITEQQTPEQESFKVEISDATEEAEPVKHEKGSTHSHNGKEHKH